MLKTYIKLFLLANIFSTQFSLTTSAMNSEDLPQEIRKKQITFKEACPGIRLILHNQSIIVKLEDDITKNAKRNFSTIINKDKNFLNRFKNRYVKFLGLNDQHILFTQGIFPILLENNVHCIVPHCQQGSQLDMILSEYYRIKPGSVSVYRDDEISLTEWIENSQYHQDMLDAIEEPKIDFFRGGGLLDYDENYQTDQQSTIEYLRDHID